MKTTLFTTEKEETYFYNLLAARKLKDKRNEREGYEAEIEEALDTCGKILKEHGARSNFIEDIHKLEISMEPKGILPPSSTREESQYTEQIAVLTTELKEFLKKLPLEITEDLGFYSKQINDRRSRREGALEYETNIIELYPESAKVNYEEVFSVLTNIFTSISDYTGENTLEKEEVVPVNDNIIEINKYRQEVKGIKKAPNSILKKANLIDLTDYQEKLNEPITNTPLMEHNDLSDELNEIDITQQEQSFTPDSISLITEEELNGTLSDETVLNIENTEKEPEKVVEEIIKTKDPEIVVQQNVEVIAEKEPEEVIEETIEAKDPEIDVQQNVEVIAEKEPEREEQEATLEKDNIVQFPDSNLEKEQQFEDEGLITFEMPEDFTLIDLASALCGNAEGWLDIYAANKERFDEIIQEKNNGIVDNIENNGNLFAGLTIKVPTIFNEVAKEEVLKKTA